MPHIPTLIDYVGTIYLNFRIENGGIVLVQKRCWSCAEKNFEQVELIRQNVVFHEAGDTAEKASQYISHNDGS